jgi:hypothetical protein
MPKDSFNCKDRYLNALNYTRDFGFILNPSVTYHFYQPSKERKCT